MTNVVINTIMNANAAAACCHRYSNSCLVIFYFPLKTSNSPTIARLIASVFVVTAYVPVDSDYIGEEQGRGRLYRKCRVNGVT